MQIKRAKEFSHTALFLLIGLTISLFFGAQSSASGTETTNYKVEQLSRANEYIIGLGDVLEVMVWREPDLTRIQTVRLDGRITIPMVGEVVASGKSPRELAAHLENKLRQLISEPSVSVMLAESKSRRYYIIGQINTPGEFSISYPITILQAIARAGGFLEWAKTSTISIVRRGSSREDIIRFDYDAFAKGQNLGQNILIAAGDTIIVP